MGTISYGMSLATSHQNQEHVEEHPCRTNAAFANALERSGRKKQGDSVLSIIALEKPTSMMDSVRVLRELLAVLELRATVRAHHVMFSYLSQGRSS
jgi:hypothetical protein